jgi:hypothetical protein
MSEPATTAPVTSTDPGTAAPEAMARRCPWCSEVLPDSATDRCPSCKANLVAQSEDRLPGLTEVEAAATTKARIAEPAKRSKLLSWISGEIDDSQILGAPTPTEALAPPSKEVRREIWRLTLESEGLEVSPEGDISLPRPQAAPATTEAETSNPESAQAS